MRPTPFVFLDRDGTLVEEVGYGHRLEDYALLPGTIAGLHLLRDAGYRFAIVTNQSGIGRGLFTRADFERFHGRLLDDLAAAAIRIEATYMCPHTLEDACRCRKPSPESLLGARATLGADLARSWVVGDHAVDVRLANAAGSRGILVLTGHGEDERIKLDDTPVDAVVPDILAAARHILAHPA